MGGGKHRTVERREGEANNKYPGDYKYSGWGRAICALEALLSSQRDSKESGRQSFLGRFNRKQQLEEVCGPNPTRKCDEADLQNS